MLYHYKSIKRESGIMTAEYREGVNGKGNTLYIIVTYYGYNTNYHAEIFDNANEAMNWYNQIT